jgi:hypothetical protein
MKAAYRFFDNDKVTFEKILAPHIERSRERVAAQPVALLVQDTSELDVTRPEQDVKGAGELDGSRQGFLLHEMQAFAPDATPLGTVWAEILNRTEGVSHAPAAEKREQRRLAPIEEKESMRWLTGLRQASSLAQETPGTQCVCIADSEADIYEVFAEPRGERPVDWLIRACHDRVLARESNAPAESESPRYLLDLVLATPLLYKSSLTIRGRTAKTGAEDRARRQNRETRSANMEVRASKLTLRPPARPDRKLPPVSANVVLVHEPNPPAKAEPVEWILVTTLPIETSEQVRKVVEYYCSRWTIEIFFRTLKQGCRIEHRRFENIERLLPCLAICLIAAWRTLFVCRTGRNCPDLDCDAIFEPSEWKAVWVAVHRSKPPKKVPKLLAMVHLIASLGGYVERPNNEPGTQTLWIGLQRMYDLAWAWDTFGPGAKLPP